MPGSRIRKSHEGNSPPAGRRERRPRLLVSRCLLGEPVRYDGRAKPLPAPVIDRLHELAELVPVCPERLGGLPTPRPPAEITGGTGRDVLTGRACVRTHVGRDVTQAFVRGAEETARIAREHGCRLALLKENSPSCGCTAIYDGTHTGTCRPGEGVTTAALRKIGLACLSETAIDELFRRLEEGRESDENSDG